MIPGGEHLPYENTRQYLGLGWEERQKDAVMREILSAMIYIKPEL